MDTCRVVQLPIGKGDMPPSCMSEREKRGSGGGGKQLEKKVI